MVSGALGYQDICQWGCACSIRFCRLDKLFLCRVGISQRPQAPFYCTDDRWTRQWGVQICICCSTYTCPFGCIPLEGAPRFVKLRWLARIPSSKWDMGILSSSGCRGIRRWRLGRICHRNRKWRHHWPVVAIDCHHLFHKNATSTTPLLLQPFSGVASCWASRPFSPASQC